MKKILYTIYNISIRWEKNYIKTKQKKLKIKKNRKQFTNCQNIFNLIKKSKKTIQKMIE